MSSKGNKSAKQALIRLYGAECFIEKLHLRPDTERKYTGKAQYHRMKQLTYHHIQERSKGGKATIENGALLSAENHEWFNKQSKEKQAEMNAKFQEYKASFKINCATLVPTPKEIKIDKPELVELEEDDIPEEIKAGVIRLEPNTPEEEKMLIERRKRVWKKFGKEYEPPIKPASIDIKEQNEFHREIIEEIRM